MSVSNKYNVEASDKISNKKTKVDDTRGGSNTRSWIWLYFDPVYIDNVRHAVCKVEIVKGKKNAAKNTRSTRQRVTALFISQTFMIQLCQYLADWIITDSQPLTILENLAFKKFIIELDPKFKILCIKSIKKLVHMITRSNIFAEFEIYDDDAMRFYWKKDNAESYLSSILDPRVKKFDFAPEKFKQVQELLSIKYNETRSTILISINNTSSTSYFHNTTVSPFYKPTLLNIFNNSLTLNLQSELDEYLAVPQIPFESDPFAWWNMNKERFPVIS
ncbi:40085_t:CDS:2, partial [Gigaspora margarita]